MSNRNESRNGTASNAVNTHLSSGQVLNNLEKDSKILYDLYDLEKIFQVTRRTLFNWQAKNELPLINLGGKLYLSHGKLMSIIEEKERRLQ